MADEIGQRETAARIDDERRAKVDAELFEQLVDQLDRLLPECAQALTELGVKPTLKLGFMKYGWAFSVRSSEPSADRIGDSERLIVVKSGTWVFAQGSTPTARQAWIERGKAVPRWVAPESIMRKQLLAQVQRLYDDSKLR